MRSLRPSKRKEVAKLRLAAQCSFHSMSPKLTPKVQLQNEDQKTESVLGSSWWANGFVRIIPFIPNKHNDCSCFSDESSSTGAAIAGSLPAGLCQAPSL